MLEDHGIEGKKLTWKGLSYEANLDVLAKTMKRAMGTPNYHICLACRKMGQSLSSEKANSLV